MSYGLPYMGSKSRIADKILDLIPPGEVFVDLFAGGCAVTHAAILRKQYRRYIVNDITDYPDLFLRACQHPVFFSEYSAPQDFALIAQFEVQKNFCDCRKETYSTERVYANPPALAIFKEARRDLFTEETL